MKKACLALIIVVITNVLYAQNVATINGRPIDGKEFLWVYSKNHASATKPDSKTLEAYLNLYINFKLKVAEAKALGLDLDTAYQHEINGYEQALNSQNKISKQSVEYGYIMNEYREGVLMFNVCEQKIWGKAQEDDTKLKTFYDANADKYENRSFDEVRGQVIGDYQQKLEEDWIKDLRSKYTIKINNAALKKLAKQ